MADLEEIAETPRTDIESDFSNEERDQIPRRNSTKRKRSKKRRNSSRSQSPAQTPPPDQTPEGRQKKDENLEQRLRERADSTKQEVMPTKEDHRARFYDNYRKVAEEYDKEFLKKYDEDLNTTLIFAGLFSAVASAFIIQVDSQLQPDPNEDTAALLRVLIYKIDNTSFGDDVPTLPQWSGPPHTMVQVQTILFASLTISLFSAFLAMLGKQWLNRYESTDMRGSAIERSHSRQRKLGGIVGWYFDNVMESLPLMLQAGLLLLGCALSRYLWEIDITIASVVLGVTSFGLIFYLFIVIAGTVSESCPYQTPAAHIFRHVLHYLRVNLLPVLQSAPAVISIIIPSTLSRLFEASWCCRFLLNWLHSTRRPWYSMTNVTTTLLYALAIPLVAIPHDAYYLAWAAVQLLVALNRTLYYRLVDSLRAAFHWFTNISFQTLSFGQQTITMDLRYISWILQTSLDKIVHLSAFKHLISIPDLTRFHPTLVVDCFNIFIGCVNVSDGRVVILHGLEELATVSANGFLHTLRHLATIDPASSALAHLKRRYNDVFPSDVDFADLPFHSVMVNIHTLASRFGNPRDIQWSNYGLSLQEYIASARQMTKTAREKYDQSRDGRVPRWILRSALYLLSLGPLSPASVVADCLTIIAIELGCDVSNAATFDESTRVDHVSNLITRKLETMVRAANPGPIFSKRKAISILLPYAIFLEQGGQQGMVDAISRAARVSDSDDKPFMWHPVILYISRLFEQRSPTSLNRVIALISPFVPWDGALNNKVAVTRWAAAASAIPYTEEVGQSVVVALLQIASVRFLRPHVPIDMWGWIKRPPSLPLTYNGRLDVTHTALIPYIRRLGDIDILKSYLFLVWTDRDPFRPGSILAMETSVREVFGGIGMEDHRQDLIEHLDRVLEQLNRRPESLSVREVKKQYSTLKDLLGEGTRR